MNKNIIIIGASRVGKTTLARKINKTFGYSVISLDDIICAFEKSFPLLEIKHDGNEIDVATRFAPFLINYLKELSEGPNYYNNCNFVIEGTHIDFEKVIKSIDLKKYTIIGLTYNDINYEDLLEKIRRYDTEDDWTFWCSKEELEGNINYFIDRNKIFNEKFIEYKIKSYDVSDDREQTLDEIILELSKLISK